ncbi:MAG: hypothetical protein Tsb0014_35290 [Pleurocapsa sp.]
MLVTTLLILSLCIGTILLTIHGSDEIHQILAFLSGLIAVVCVFILTPPLIKGLLGLIFFTMGHKFLPTYKSFR